jgi:hypothetical protein
MVANNIPHKTGNGPGDLRWSWDQFEPTHTTHEIPSSCPAASPSEEIPIEESTSVVSIILGINETLTRPLPKLTQIMLSQF